MVRVMCGLKVADRKTTEKQMDMLGLRETIDHLATANEVRWYGHVLRRDDDSVFNCIIIALGRQYRVADTTGCF